jgi:hypothetical protein
MWKSPFGFLIASEIQLGLKKFENFPQNKNSD